jgi:RNA polymerase sigma-70 factor (sigma-E family)
MISIGDIVTFEELYAQQYQPMVRLAHTLVDTQQRAEEVVQDAFAAIYERYDRIERPDAYLRVTVLNGCRRVLRRRMLQRAQPIPPGQNGELAFNHVVDAIRRLPHRQRSMVVLRYDLQLTDAEIADTLRVPLGTVKSSLHRALGALRKELTDARSV